METETDEAPDAAELAERQDRLEAKLEQNDSKLDELIDLVKGKLPGGKGKERGEEETGSVADQVRAELARSKAAEAAEKEEADDKADRAELRARVDALSEKAPQPPVKKVTKWLGWGDGRQ